MGLEERKKGEKVGKNTIKKKKRSAFRGKKKERKKTAVTDPRTDLHDPSWPHYRY